MRICFVKRKIIFENSLINQNFLKETPFALPPGQLSLKQLQINMTDILSPSVSGKKKKTLGATIALITSHKIAFY